MFRIGQTALMGVLLLGLIAGSGVSSPAGAQFFGRPSGEVPQGGQSDMSALLLRVDRLENTIRTLNGQVEQLQFQNRRLEEQLQRFQKDVDFRFQELGGRKPAPANAPQRRSDMPDEAPVQTGALVPQPPVTQAPGGMTPQQILPPAQRGAGRNDAFDPSSQPNAPGAPRTLGTTPPSAPIASQPVQPVRPGMTAMPVGPIMDDEDGAAHSPGAPVPGQGPRTVASITPPPSAGVGPRDDYSNAVNALRSGQYETAEIGLKGYIEKNPTDRFVPDAIYYLGESYSQRGRHREAAEQYLKLSTDYAKSSRAADGMLRLGGSLVALGAKEQACATYGEIARKYPSATNTIRRAEGEMKKSRC